MTSVPLPRELILVIEPSGLTLDWSPSDVPIDPELDQAQRTFYDEWRQAPDGAWLHAAFRKPALPGSDAWHFVWEWSRHFVEALTHVENLEDVREHVHLEPSEAVITKALSRIPDVPGEEHVDSPWLKKFWSRLEAAFQAEMRQYSGTVFDYFLEQGSDIHPQGRIFFHLVESKDAQVPFAFLATYAPSGQGRHVPLKNALTAYSDSPQQLLKLLSSVSRAAEESGFLAGLLESGEIFQPLKFSRQDAYHFLKDVPLYERAGIRCRIPKWWKGTTSRVRATVTMGEVPPTRVGADAILDFQVGLALGDDPLTAEDLRALLNETEGLAYLKGKWVEVDHEALQKLLATYESLVKRADQMSILDALGFELYRPATSEEAEGAAPVEISHGAWFSDMMNRLKERPLDTSFNLGPQWRAHLREYQERGLAWLWQMRQWGLGALLADDMGLGKTVQVLALLTALRQNGPISALLIVPASLLGNWTDEIEKFSPGLVGVVAHPSSLHPADGDKLDQADVVITTYSMADRYGWLRDRTWDVLVLDEAQAIKNPGTKQAKAVKAIPARFRIALTGTPVENRLTDLWSLFDFLNQGLLGAPKEFARYIKELGERPDGYAPLRQLVGPFILRRVKTDRAIIQDLPEKIEMTARATLGRRQAALYLEVVENLERQLKEVDGSERKGLILASLMKLKQICNHPDQYLGQSVFHPEESGKFERLKGIAETIRERHERVLVFTQFREMTDPLSAFLASIFGRSGLILHGQTPVSERRQLVQAFQGPDYVPFMVLSLKAGGVGLNLTRANHVVHFDRWWNPAVENQATDRAFRIGQTKNVLVHKFVTIGTIEEKIERMILDKHQLAQDIVPTKQETWIGDLDNESLMQLLRLEAREFDVAL